MLCWSCTCLPVLVAFGYSANCRLNTTVTYVTAQGTCMSFTKVVQLWKNTTWYQHSYRLQVSVLWCLHCISSNRWAFQDHTGHQERVHWMHSHGLDEGLLNSASHCIEIQVWHVPIAGKSCSWHYSDDVQSILRWALRVREQFQYGPSSLCLMHTFFCIEWSQLRLCWQMGLVLCILWVWVGIVRCVVLKVFCCCDV